MRGRNHGGGENWEREAGGNSSTPLPSKRKGFKRHKKNGSDRKEVPIDEIASLFQNKGNGGWKRGVFQSTPKERTGDSTEQFGNTETGGSAYRIRERGRDPPEKKKEQR